MKSKQLADNFTHQSLIVGSFRKHYEPITEVIRSFHANGIEVLSPREAKILNPDDEFVIFSYDPSHLSEKELEDLVLDKMHRSHFVYLVNPGGYVGLSAAFEIGYCAAHGIDVYAMEPSNELCMKYIKAIKSPEEMISFALQEYKSITK
jgi:hypothetical protein